MAVTSVNRASAGSVTNGASASCPISTNAIGDYITLTVNSTQPLQTPNGWIIGEYVQYGTMHFYIFYRRVTDSVLSGNAIVQTVSGNANIRGRAETYRGGLAEAVNGGKPWYDENVGIAVTTTSGGSTFGPSTGVLAQTGARITVHSGRNDSQGATAITNTFSGNWSASVSSATSSTTGNSLILGNNAVTGTVPGTSTLTQTKITTHSGAIAIVIALPQLGTADPSPPAAVDVLQISVGSATLPDNKLYVGSTKVNKVYVGSTLVYDDQ